MYENNQMGPADFQAMMGGNGGMYGGGMMWFWWVILFFICGGNGGWGWGGNNSTSNEVQRGFDQSAIMGGLTGVQGSIANLGTAMNAGFANAETGACARQMANMNQLFGMQTGITGQMNTLAMGQQSGIYENRAAIADLKYTVANEGCADRNALSIALRDVLTATQAQNQRIIDQMCQDKIDAKNERIAELQQQLYMAQLAASQSNQTARIEAGQRALANEVEQYVLPTPRPAYIVQNPNCCGQYNPCCGYAA